MHLGIAVLFIALILFGILAFLQVSALILAPLVSVFVILLSQFSAGRITILEGLTSMFMPAAAEYVSSYFLVFFVGALFGAVYQYTGAAESIAHWIAGFCKGHCPESFQRGRHNKAVDTGLYICRLLDGFHDSPGVTFHTERYCNAKSRYSLYRRTGSVLNCLHC